MVPADPPRIEFSREVKVFPPTILQVSDSASGMSLRSSDDGSTFYLEFKYVAPRAGLAAQFVHTGTNLGVLTPAGRLVGDQYLEFGDPWNRRFPVVSGIVGLAGFFALIFLANSVSYGSVLVSLAFIFLFGGFGVMFVLTRYGSRWQIRPNNVLAAYVPAVGENLPKRGQLLKQASQGPTTKSKKTMR